MHPEPRRQRARERGSLPGSSPRSRTARRRGWCRHRESSAAGGCRTPRHPRRRAAASALSGVAPLTWPTKRSGGIAAAIVSHACPIAASGTHRSATLAPSAAATASRRPASSTSRPASSAARASERPARPAPTTASGARSAAGSKLSVGSRSSSRISEIPDERCCGSRWVLGPRPLAAGRGQGDYTWGRPAPKGPKLRLRDRPPRSVGTTTMATCRSTSSCARRARAASSAWPMPGPRAARARSAARSRRRRVLSAPARPKKLSMSPGQARRAEDKRGVDRGGAKKRFKQQLAREAPRRQDR